MTTVRILTARGGYPCGAIAVVADDVAQTWIGVGDAEAVQTSAQDAAAAAPGALPLETATAGAGVLEELHEHRTDVVETAMKKKAKGR